jgi:hypothetical protein
MARMRIRAGRHVGWEGEFVAELSDAEIVYLRVEVAPGRTALLVADRASVEPLRSAERRAGPRPLPRRRERVLGARDIVPGSFQV